MSGRPDFTTPGSGGSGQTIAVQNRPEMDYLELDQTGSVASGVQENVEIYAPTGAVYRPVAMFLKVTNDADATGGSHYFRVSSLGKVIAMAGESAHNSRILWNENHWREADQSKRPPDTAAAVNGLHSLRATENEPILVQYDNSTDAAMENDRLIRFVMEVQGY